MTAGSIGEGEGAFSRESIAIAVVDADARLLRVNQAFSRMTGIVPDSRERGGAMSLQDMLAPTVDATALLDLLTLFDTSSGVIASRSIDFLRADGRSIGQAEVGVIDQETADDGRPSRTVLSFVDLTQGCGGQVHDDATVRSAETRYKDIYEHVAEGIYRSSLDGVQLSANPALVKLNGYETEAEMLTAANDLEEGWYVDPGRRGTFKALLARQGYVRDFVSEIYRHKTRERIWISENARLVRDPETGQPLCYEGTVREVTATVVLLREKEKLDKIAAQAPGCLFQSCFPAKGRPYVSYASAGLTDLCGLDPKEMMADMRSFERRVHPHDRDGLSDAIAESSRTLRPWRHEFRMRRKDGIDVWVGGAAMPEKRPDGTIVWHGFLQDVTEARQAQARIHDLAYYDTLTGLPNRQMLRDRAAQELASSDRSGHYGAALFIDLDNFKLLNDTHGHHVGDRLLVEIAGRLSGVVRKTDLVARLGGDEFVVLLSQLSADPAAALQAADGVAQKLRESVNRPCLLGEAEDGSGETISFQTSPSIGVEMFRGRAVDFDTILKRADMAMYRAKSSGRNEVCHFSVPLEQETRETASIASQVREAIETGAIDLYVQPIVGSGGRVLGGEALLRWLHPERGVLAPKELLTMADRIGLSARLHDLILRKAFAISASWRSAPSLGALSLSINIAPMQIQAPGFAEVVSRTIARSGAAPERIVMEITEHAVLDDIDAVAQTMQTLRDAGIRFALDDFGTGYGSLTYMKRLPFDEIKIDQSFVRDIAHDRDANVIVGTTIIGAHQLGLSVTGEGVETAEQAQTMIGFGADRLQGYLFGRPMPEASFRKLVAEAEAERIAAAGRSNAAADVRRAG